MSRSTKIPKTASTMAEKEFQVAIQPSGMKAVVCLQLLSANASRGYQTDYQHIPVRYVVVEVRAHGKLLYYADGRTQRRWVHVFSGKRLDEAPKLYKRYHDQFAKEEQCTTHP